MLIILINYAAGIFMKTPFQETRTLLTVRRMLHIIGLLQNNKDPRQWNYNSLSEKLELDPRDETIDDVAVKNCIKLLKNDNRLSIKTGKGQKQIEPLEPISTEYLAELLTVYTSFVVHDDTRSSIIRRLIEKNETQCMWNIASIHFASLEKRVITFKYTNNEAEYKDYTVKPFHLVAKGQSIYLMGIDCNKNGLRQYILDKIENLKISENHFEDAIPDPETYFQYSISPFIRKPVRMKIKHLKDRNVHQEIYQILNILGDIEIVKKGRTKQTTRDITVYEFDDHYIAEFKIADYEHLLKHLFYYGNKVEILEPASIRQNMKQMLEDSLSVYK